MGFWSRMLGRKSEAKGLSVSLEPGGFVTELHRYRRPHYPDASTDDLQDAQTRNELVFACLDIKSKTAQDPRLIVQEARQQRGKVEYQEVVGHPLRQLMMRPNERMTEADLMKAAIVSWDISNPRRFYCEKEYTGGLLTALYPLNPSLMRPRYSRENQRRLIGYEWNDGSDRKEYSLDDLLIRTAPAWYDPPPLVSALGSVESDTSQTDYVRAFFDGGGVPAGLLKYKMPLNDAQRDEIRAKWRTRHGNALGRQHEIGVLDANVEYEALGSTLDKLHSQVLRSVAESRICMVFGIPPLIVYAYVGLIRATYSNLKEAWSGFWDATASPMYKEWRSFWLWGLLSEFEEERDIRAERVRLAYDMSAVAALQDDVDLAQNRARSNFSAGGISFNEFRTAIGHAPVTGGDELYVPQTLGPLGTARAATAPAVPPKGRKDRSQGSVQLTERRMEQALQTYLADEYRKAEEAVRAAD